MLSRKKKQQWRREKTTSRVSSVGTVASMVTRDKAAGARTTASLTSSNPDLETKRVEATKAFAATVTREDTMKMNASRKKG